MRIRTIALACGFAAIVAAAVANVPQYMLGVYLAYTQAGVRIGNAEVERLTAPIVPFPERVKGLKSVNWEAIDRTNKGDKLIVPAGSPTAGGPIYRGPHFGFGYGSRII